MEPGEAVGVCDHTDIPLGGQATLTREIDHAIQEVIRFPSGIAAYRVARLAHWKQ